MTQRQQKALCKTQINHIPNYALSYSSQKFAEMICTSALTCTDHVPCTHYTVSHKCHACIYIGLCSYGIVKTYLNLQDALCCAWL
jgi:hypothetical protein